jgi:hypothetical protein
MRKQHTQKKPLNVRLTAKEHAELKRRSELANITITEAVRLMIGNLSRMTRDEIVSLKIEAMKEGTL